MRCHCLDASAGRLGASSAQRLTFTQFRSYVGRHGTEFRTQGKPPSSVFQPVGSKWRATEEEKHLLSQSAPRVKLAQGTTPHATTTAPQHPLCVQAVVGGAAPRPTTYLQELPIDVLEACCSVLSLKDKWAALVAGLTSTSSSELAACGRETWDIAEVPQRFCADFAAAGSALPAAAAPCGPVLMS